MKAIVPRQLDDMIGKIPIFATEVVGHNCNQAVKTLPKRN